MEIIDKNDIKITLKIIKNHEMILMKNQYELRDQKPFKVYRFPIDLYTKLNTEL